ncbi:MAG: 50S ribosomal protein L21e [Candidatus Aenigmarchaeota archaeon]|nr:50S ribosomal protein L21e [Candidatus Aenigmarchaeota archaeon]
MVTRSKGMRRRTRNKLKGDVRSKFKITPFLQEFRIKDKVVLKIDPSSQKGFPHPMFKGKTCEVVGKRGDAYLLELRFGNKLKKLIARPEHLVLKK